MEFRLLGSLEVTAEGKGVAVRGAKQRALLAVLLLHRGEVVSRDRLLSLVWGDDQPGNAPNTLQAQVSQLRRTLAPADIVVTRHGGYTAEVAEDDLDTSRFERLCAAGGRALADGRAADAAAALREALALWRGPALADFAYEEFAQGAIARLENLRLVALEQRIEADLALGRHAEVAAELEEACRTHPLRERLWAHRMVALYRCGRQADALRAYADAREHLVEELGIEPGPELRELETLVLTQAPSLAPVAAPERPVRTKEPPRRRGNLRARLTTFVGRDADVLDVTGLLGTARLVTLVGPGGTGKTRLAVEVADRVADTVDGGVWLVELAGVDAPAGVAPAIAAVLGRPDASGALGTGSEAGSVLDAGIERVGDESVLLVIDNCEHVVVEVARVVHELLGRAPGVRVLATSREALGVPGEVVRAVEPLDEAAAVELFLDRARAADTRFSPGDDAITAVAEVCRGLDGLPLAIELAAARLRALPLEHVAARLDDRFRLLTGGPRTALPRQQTLRAVVDWSYDLLFSDERRLFVRLSVFRGGCTLAAAVDVCADALLPEDEVVDLLTKLVEKSLVRVERTADGVRYSQLQTVWAYARERLDASGEADGVRGRHARYFAALADRAAEGLRGRTGTAWRAALRADLDNLRAALDWAVEHDDAETALDLASGTAWLWFLGAEWHEATRWLGDALAARGHAPPATRARATAWFAYFSAIRHGAASHLDAAADAVDVLRAEGPSMHLGEAILLYASTLQRARRDHAALAALDEGHEVLSQLGHEWGLGVHDLLRATTLLQLERFDEAEQAATASIDRLEALGEPWVLVEPLGVVAAVREVRGDVDGAIVAYERLAQVAAEAELPAYRLYWVLCTAAARARAGDDGAAEAAFAEVARESRNPVVTAAALVGGARAARRQDAAAAVEDDLHQAVSLLQGVQRPDAEGVVLGALALCAAETGDLERAQALGTRADGLHPQSGAAALAVAALAEGSTDKAAALVADALARRLPVVPGSFGALEVPDLERLAARVTAHQA